MIFQQIAWPAATVAAPNPSTPHFWDFQSIDTMKYSRDLAREKLHDPGFDAVIDMQVKNIAATGATHVAIGTPYDEEFLPFLARWVSAARRYDLLIWFRGNFAGWEGWFDYPKISRTEHLVKTETFILANSFYFEDGDVFTACPECENGGAGDPRRNGDLAGHRQFLIAEHEIVKNDFQKLGKKVISYYHSMNADVASLVMDKDTTAKLGGVVTIDHYVETPEQLAGDIQDLARKSGGQIVLGEYGFPIPDLHEDLTGEEQADFLGRALAGLRATEELIGLNYWTSVGGSTALWDSQGTPRRAVGVIEKYYRPKVFAVIVKDELDRQVPTAEISVNGTSLENDAASVWNIPFTEGQETIVDVSAEGYGNQHLVIRPNPDQSVEIALAKEKKNRFYRFLEFLKRTWEKIANFRSF